MSGKWDDTYCYHKIHHCWSNNTALAAIIRRSLEEFDANKPELFILIPLRITFFDLFRMNGSAYFVAADGDAIWAVPVFFPQRGYRPAPVNWWNSILPKMPEGKRTGQKLMAQCLQSRERYRLYQCLPGIDARTEYCRTHALEKMGFEYLPGPLGKSATNGCGIWILKNITAGMDFFPDCIFLLSPHEISPLEYPVFVVTGKLVVWQRSPNKACCAKTVPPLPVFNYDSCKTGVLLTKEKKPQPWHQMSKTEKKR